MPQSDLFEGTPDNPYQLFGELPEDYPVGEFEPLYPDFNKRGYVTSGVKVKRRFFVDLAIGECSCPVGHAWAWGNIPTKKDPDGKWYQQKYCVHKLRMLCSIIEDYSTPERKANKFMGHKIKLMEQAYVKAVGTRYNAFEVVSAFHKELRRGDFEAAWFWGLMLSTKRGLHGIIRYLLNILYEETRDHELGEWLIPLAEKGRSITLSECAQAILLFCKAKKKWELPHRYQIFLAEMEGYKLLGQEYGWDVAKGADIIPADQESKLKRALEDGFKKKNLAQFQRGWKGLQKMKFVEKHTTLEDYRYYLYEYLYDFAERNLPDEHPVWGVVSTVNQRIAAGFGAGYHELNAIADALAGEPYEAGNMPADQRERLLKRPTPAIPLGYWPDIPLYAADNHTWAGKALMRRFPDQLKPGAEQKDLDFRYCGAYFGVCWRILAFDQHKSTEVAWHDVKWPAALYRIVNAMWY